MYISNRNLLAARLLLLLLCLALPMSARAEEGGWIARCSEPAGLRSEFGTVESLTGESIFSEWQGFRRNEDGYTGSYPTFVLSGHQSTSLVRVWTGLGPDADVAEVIAHRNARRDPIILRQGVRIDTINSGGGETWTMAFYPDMGIAFATRLGHFQLGAESRGAFASIFELKCEFQPLQ